MRFQAHGSILMTPLWWLIALTIAPMLGAQNPQADQSCKPYPDLTLQPPAINMSPGPEYAPSTRMYQAGPTIERTRSGRLWAAWTSGGLDEGPYNYIILSTSEDDGNTWSAKLVIDPSGNISSSGPLLWIDIRGRLWLFWKQAYADSIRGSVWATVANNPGSAKPAWSPPIRIADGSVGGKPVILKNGDWLLPVYVGSGTADFDEALDYYHLGLSPCVVAALKKQEESRSKGTFVYRSRDEGKSWEPLGQATLSAEAIANGQTAVEHAIVERKDGSLWMLARTPPGIGQSFSRDGGKTWTVIEPSGIRHPLSRFFIRRLQSGKLLMIRHNPPSVEYPKNCNNCGEMNRSHLTAYLSDDDGSSWTGDLLLDERATVSYPDGAQGADGTIFIVYDRDRRTAREILLSSFKEDDILKGGCVTPTCRLRVVVSKGASNVALSGTGILPETTLANEQPTRALTSEPHFHDEIPSVAPDGKHIVFSRQQLEPKRKPRLWVMNIDGTSAHPITPADFALECDYPAWSPDGSVIAFRAGPDMNAGGIWLIGADGRNIRRLTDEKKSDDMYPTWSPDGTWMVISRGPITQEPTNHLWQVKLDGSQRQLTNGDNFEGRASLAPDGQHIAFSTDRPDRHFPATNVWITTVDNSEENARPFTSLGGVAPAWSPDGKWIAFSSNREGGGYAVYLRQVIGGPAIRVTPPASTDNNHPSWSRDGTLIVFDQYDAAEHSHLKSADVSKILAIR